ncbi:hypothetical protein VE02_02160 [Pseudogymnoascus sp. 03VT05]|nr:hypothetical protein VE02_02160 [Pseudogymnoascus sp. 03VT05]
MADASQLHVNASQRTLASSEGVRKRRALTACHHCRKRKVRCDMSNCGPPCTNCRLDRNMCIAAPNRRRSLKDAGPRYSERTSRATNQSAYQEIRPLVVQSGQWSDVESSQATVPASVYVAWPSAEEGSISDCAIPSYQEAQPSVYSNAATRAQQIHESVHQNIDNLEEHQINFEVRPESTNRTTVQLPTYIRQVPANFSQEDIEYLAKKKVFAVPNTWLRNSLLRCYVNWVHPYLPSLDLDEFLIVIESDDNSRGTVSLLVLYAVMFAGASFVDISYLQEAGYSTRLAARQDFFQRAKCLYDIKYELDRLRVVQALLLMSYCQAGHDNQMNNQYCDFDLPIPIEQDFDVAAFPLAVVSMLGGCEVLRNTDHQLQLARLCVEMTKLCQIMGEIFSTQYVTVTPKLGTTNEPTLVLIPNDSGEGTASRDRIQEKLEEWFKKLPSKLQSQTLQWMRPEQGEEVLFTHTSFLHMFYHAIFITLYCPLMTSPSQPVPVGIEIVRRRLRHSAASINRHAEDLQNQDLLSMLPSSSVTTLSIAAVNHLVESTISPGDQREHSLRRLWDCLAYLRSLGESHACARFAVVFLKLLTRQAGVLPPSTSANFQLEDFGP